MMVATSLPDTVQVYTYCYGELLSSLAFILKTSWFDDKLYGHPA